MNSLTTLSSEILLGFSKSLEINISLIATTTCLSHILCLLSFTYPVHLRLNYLQSH
jgi:hypothetical protein